MFGLAPLQLAEKDIFSCGRWKADLWACLATAVSESRLGLIKRFLSIKEYGCCWIKSQDQQDIIQYARELLTGIPYDSPIWMLRAKRLQMTWHAEAALLLPAEYEVPRSNAPCQFFRTDILTKCWLKDRQLELDEFYIWKPVARPTHSARGLGQH